ncbi:uncharacterized protein V1518DRAFT_411530 [Limtongia smithiae]|uniref:uncharacterized protein n=1 Tax=Limtongia smithiae TaxID=1125753 RepID=UPI0034CE19B4
MARLDEVGSAFFLCDDISTLASEYAFTVKVVPLPEISTALAAELDVYTQEGNKARLSVSRRGWMIKDLVGVDIDSEGESELRDLIYENFEEAVSSVSPAFTRDLQSRLMQKLESLASGRFLDDELG